MKWIGVLSTMYIMYVNLLDICICSGSEQLKELVPLEDDGDKQPRIRIAHPITTMPLEGRRKRQREAITDYSWAVGDRVDAWMQNWYHIFICTEYLLDETCVIRWAIYFLCAF